jgi:hypothetical protein
MADMEAFTALNYPGEDGSEIVTNATGFGFMDALFSSAVRDYGNDEAASWPSASETGVSFDVRFDGMGTTIQEGTTWPIWLLSLHRGETTKILKVDIANCSSERWTEDGFVPGDFKDNSDLIAAALNLREFNDARLDEGDGPLAVFRRAFKLKMREIESQKNNPDQQ